MSKTQQIWDLARKLRRRPINLYSGISSKLLIVGRTLSLRELHRRYRHAVDRTVHLTLKDRTTGVVEQADLVLSMRDNEADTVWTLTYAGKFLAGGSEALNSFEKATGLNTYSFDLIYHRFHGRP